MNPFTKTGKTPRLGVKSFSVEDVKASNKRFYEKFPSAKEDAAMLKKAMYNKHFFLPLNGISYVFLVSTVYQNIHQAAFFIYFAIFLRKVVVPSHK